MLPPGQSLVEARKRKGILRLGTPDSSALIVTKRQVEEMLRSGGTSELPDTPATLADLRSLCAALLEQLQDKCTALTHQRRANRLLADHCSELRQLADRHGLAVHPSSLLMEGYSATNMDRESEQILASGQTRDSASSPISNLQSPTSPTDSSSSAGGPRSPTANGRHSDGSDGSSSSPTSGRVAATRPASVDRVQTSPGGTAASPGRTAQGQLLASPSRLVTPTGGQLPASPNGRLLGATSPVEEEEEILSIQQLDRYVRCLRGGGGGEGGARPARVLGDDDDFGGSGGRTERAPEVQVVNSPQRAGGERRGSTELPEELDALYRRALEELRAGEEAL